MLQLSDCEVISCAKLSLKVSLEENISYLDLGICLGSLGVKFLFIFSFQADDWRFWAKSDWYLVFIISSTSTKAPVSADKNQLQSMIPPPPWLTMGMVTCFWETLAFFFYLFFLQIVPGLGCLETLPHSPLIWQHHVVICSTQPLHARNTCTSFSIAEGVLAASLIVCF